MKNIIIARLVVLLAVALILVPFGILIHGSLQGKGIVDYIDVMVSYNIGRNFLNSLIISVSSVAIITLIVIFGAFAFSKINFPFKNVLYLFVLTGLLLPGAVIMVPVFQMSKLLGAMNTYWVVIGPIIAMSAPFNLLIARNYYDGLPNSLLEAAYIDGCSLHRMLWSVVMPLSRPVLMIIIIWGFLGAWNEYFFSVIFLRKKEMMPVTVIPSTFQQMYGGNMPKLFASLTLIVLPVIFVYMILQRYIVEGITAGAIKG